MDHEEPGGYWDKMDELNSEQVSRVSKEAIISVASKYGPRLSQPMLVASYIYNNHKEMDDAEILSNLKRLGLVSISTRIQGAKYIYKMRSVFEEPEVFVEDPEEITESFIKKMAGLGYSTTVVFTLNGRLVTKTGARNG